jgi:hypothetical protein
MIKHLSLDPNVATLGSTLPIQGLRACQPAALRHSPIFIGMTGFVVVLSLMG